MKIWPWTKFEAYERQLRIERGRLDACKLAAVGAFHLNRTPEQVKTGFDYELWSPALAEVVRLVYLLDSYPEPPPYKYRNVPAIPPGLQKERKDV